MPFPKTRAGRIARKRYNRSIKNKRVYEGLRRKGKSKAFAAKIANSAKRRRRR